MGEHRRRYNVPAGHFHVVDGAGVDTFWSVDRDGRLRDYPPGVRWRPVPPARPVDVPPEDRERWRAEWYDRVYWPYKDQVAEAISLDPLGAARRFRDRLAAGELPPEPPPRPRVRRRPSWSRPRRPSPADQRRAVEALAAVELHRAGMSIRQIADRLQVPRTSVWRRVRAAESTTGSAVARAALLQRADQLQAAMLAESVMVPENREQITEWIRDLRTVAGELCRREP